MKRSTIIVVLLACLAIAVGVGMHFYNKTTPTASERAVDLTIDARDLYAEFNKNDSAANARYSDKVIQVTGVVDEIAPQDSLITNVVLETGDLLVAILCEFDPKTVPHWTKGMTVSLKGICAGSTPNIILQRCAAVE